LIAEESWLFLENDKGHDHGEKLKGRNGSDKDNCVELNSYTGVPLGKSSADWEETHDYCGVVDEFDTEEEQGEVHDDGLCSTCSHNVEKPTTASFDEEDVVTLSKFNEVQQRTCLQHSDCIYRQPLEGSLCKYTNVVTGWQYRWFVLNPDIGKLEYFEVCMFISVLLQNFQIWRAVLR